jgi:hypothetical protein
MKAYDVCRRTKARTTVQINCGSALMQWNQAAQSRHPTLSSCGPKPSRLFGGDKQYFETRTVKYGRADKRVDDKCKEGNKRNLLRMFGMALSPMT